MSAVPARARPCLPLADRRDDRDVDLARRGDAEAFRRLFHRYRAAVEQATFSRLRDRDDAADAAQETFLKAYVGLPRLRRSAAFRTWLLRIASNTAATALGRRRGGKRGLRIVPVSVLAAAGRVAPESAWPDHRAGSCPARSLQQRELQQALESAVRALDARHRQVLHLRVCRGESYEAISRRLRTPVGTVRSRLHRARQRLRRHLEESGVSVPSPARS